MGWYQRRVHGGTTQQTMAFVRCGGRVVAYGRGERERTTWEQKMRFEERTAPPQRVVISQIGDPDAPYLKDIEQLDHENSALQREINGLKKSISSFTYTQNRHGLDAKYDFGLKGQEAVYQCMIQNTGSVKAKRLSLFDQLTAGAGCLSQILRDQTKFSSTLARLMHSITSIPKLAKRLCGHRMRTSCPQRSKMSGLAQNKNKRTTLQAVCKTCCNKHLSA